MTKLNWAGFSKKTLPERLEHISRSGLLSTATDRLLKENQQLPLETANQMVENVLATFSLPFAIVPDVLVDDKVYQVPFVTEEPSVVAACSYASKLMKRSGGLTTTVHGRQMIGQIALSGVSDMEKASKAILDQQAKLLTLANQSYPSIVKRGGGAVSCRLEPLAAEDNHFLVFYLSVDTQEAMGANMVNTMMEALVPELERLSGGQSVMAILSNYATESLVTASCRLPIRILSRDKKEAKRLAEKLVLASQLAQADPFRASTHNKGIFNGIDALVLATGNDWRAIEAGCHAYASKDGGYKGLSTWTFDSQQDEIIGQLTLPMPIATKGGSIGLNPMVQVAFDLLGQPNAKELASLIVAIGLTQNFAALKALISTGIQSGHMKLQTKSLALQAGATESELPLLLPLLSKEKHLNLDKVQSILEKIRANKYS